jgi:hypothetical protein
VLPNHPRTPRTHRQIADALRTAADVLARHAERLSPATCLQIIVREAGTEDPHAHWLCPHCDALDSIVEVDSCTRQNQLDLSYAHDGELHAQGHLAQADFQTSHYACTSCQRHLTLPDDLADVTWS